MTKEKITFNDLNTPLKLAAIGSMVYSTLWTLIFLMFVASLMVDILLI
jgi:hypothetical protein